MGEVNVIINNQKIVAEAGESKYPDPDPLLS